MDKIYFNRVNFYNKIPLEPLEPKDKIIEIIEQTIKINEKIKPLKTKIKIIS